MEHFNQDIASLIFCFQIIAGLVLGIAILAFYKLIGRIFSDFRFKLRRKKNRELSENLREAYYGLQSNKKLDREKALKKLDTILNELEY